MKHLTQVITRDGIKGPIKEGESGYEVKTVLKTEISIATTELDQEPLSPEVRTYRLIKEVPCLLRIYEERK